MSRFFFVGSLLGALGISALAEARPTGPMLFCEGNPSAPLCSGQTISCNYCHTSTAPVSWNTYGLAVIGELSGKDFDKSLLDAVKAIADQDTDGDGVSNAEELTDGTLPGDAASALACLQPASSYDYVRAFRRVTVLYCGRSPTYDERAEFAALNNEGHRKQALSEHLDECLGSKYWLEDGLARLGDVRIRPVKPVGKDGTPAVIIGDYEWDFRLWTYVLSGDRDMRDLLLADYHVARNANGELVKKTGTFSGAGLQAAFSPLGQKLEPERRAGMLTTTWFFAVNTMFSVVPRTAAAQAYRAYLGEDLAMQEGVHPVRSEPADIDGRGVGAPVCRDCHSTLDPMAYAFIWYEGILGPVTGTYSTARPRQIPGWQDNQAMLLGQPIKDVKDFAQVAVKSELFPRNLAKMFLSHAIEREPSPEETLDFETIWRGIPDDGWSANRLIHRIVESRFFGGSP